MQAKLLAEFNLFQGLQAKLHGKNQENKVIIRGKLKIKK